MCASSSSEIELTPPKAHWLLAARALSWPSPSFFSFCAKLAARVHDAFVLVFESVRSGKCSMFDVRSAKCDEREEQEAYIDIERRQKTTTAAAEELESINAHFLPLFSLTFAHQ